MGWQFYTDILQGVDIPAGKKLCEKGDFQKIVQEDFFCRDLARNAHIRRARPTSEKPIFRKPGTLPTQILLAYI